MKKIVVSVFAALISVTVLYIAFAAYFPFIQISRISIGKNNAVRKTILSERIYQYLAVMHIRKGATYSNVFMDDTEQKIDGYVSLGYGNTVDVHVGSYNNTYEVDSVCVRGSIYLDSLCQEAIPCPHFPKGAEPCHLIEVQLYNKEHCIMTILTPDTDSESALRFINPLQFFYDTIHSDYVAVLLYILEDQYATNGTYTNTIETSTDSIATIDSLPNYIRIVTNLQ